MHIGGRHIAVTGGSGLIGRRLVQALLDAEAHVTVMSRRPPQRPVPGATWQRADVTDPESLDFAPHDAVVHGAAFVAFGLPPEKEAVLMRTNVEGTRNVIAAAARDNVDKVLHVSSVAAIGETTMPRSETWVDERPLVFDSAYERSKYDAHRIVFGQDDVPVAAIMPSIVLGIGDTSSGLIMKRFLERRLPAVVRHPGSLAFVHVDDVVAGAMAALRRGTGPYIVSDLECDLPRLFAHLQEWTGVRAPRFKVPFAVAKAASRLPGLASGSDFMRSLTRHMQYDTTRARGDLDWRPDLEGGVHRDAAAFLAAV